LAFGRADHNNCRRKSAAIPLVLVRPLLRMALALIRPTALFRP
jgi:hypothetical protein